MFRLPCSKISSLRLPAAGLSSSLCRPRLPLSLLSPSFTRNRVITTTTSRLPSPRLSNVLDPKSLMEDLESELFNYTTGRFLQVSNILSRLCLTRNVTYLGPTTPFASESVGASSIFPDSLESSPKRFLASLNKSWALENSERVNRTFLISLDSGFQLVARIPYPLLIPKAYALASEVATMDLLRSKGLPVPKVYAYSFMPKNEAETEYMLMEYVDGTDLSEIWFDLEKDEVISLMDQLAKVESSMMSISFPAGGSIYYARDLNNLSGNEGIPLEEEGFCIGPDVSVPLWYGRREQLDVFRGPYEDAKSVLVTGAEKELAYLNQFGSPRAPYQHFRREYYNYEKQPPSDHAQNLRRYLRLAPWLVPEDDSLNAFCIRHPDITDSNIKVSKDSSGLRILRVLDWQHAVVLPLFLHAGMPDIIQNEEDEVSRSMIEPKLPNDFDTLSEEEQGSEMERLRRRLVHYHYNISTAAYNRIHHKGLVYPLNDFRRRIFNHATVAWEGETIKLLYALMDMVVGWADFAKDDAPCPVVFTEDEKVAAEKLYLALANADRGERMMKRYVGYAEETWVPAAHYEEAKALGQEAKRLTLEACAKDEETTKEAYAVIEANWPLDDMDEKELEAYK